ncbi:phosphatidate cytidylyltransferase [Legionella londiniensis]|uniref:Phosphatidate cytidylyltransferase n=1 Tax=Legionella londiniensis TaxID=45068 RepID=A0A0W0VMI3_9GAMM|nr:phosphatidate cytidylyltransferase [Legionella londiniensis]KTD21327.1 phosphatidate cytidylyltransferase [Legionella londiniensis]STX93617.1 phosphatidate cytidylyltransferase [Legionella londiniensis]
MFKQRLYTTLVLVPLVLLAIYLAYSWILVGVLLVIVLIGGWEWTQLIPLHDYTKKILFIALLLPAIWLSTLWLTYWLFAGIVIWGLILLAVITFPDSQKIWGFPIIVGGSCFLLLPLFASALAAIYQYPAGRDLMIYLLFLVWAADIGAYLTGKRMGKHKLIPEVSPGKTIEGVTGGFALAMAVAAAGHWYFAPQCAVYWYILSGAVALISILGDLFISILKRRCKLKDTGHIFPGHGGVLDRLDSMIAASPFFYSGLLLMPQGVVS